MSAKFLGFMHEGKLPDGRTVLRGSLEHGLKLDINKLARQGFIRSETACGAHELQWTRTATGEVVATAVITSNLTGPEEGWFRIRHGSVEQWITGGVYCNDQTHRTRLPFNEPMQSRG